MYWRVLVLGKAGLMMFFLSFGIAWSHDNPSVITWSAKGILSLGVREKREGGSGGRYLLGLGLEVTV